MGSARTAAALGLLATLLVASLVAVHGDVYVQTYGSNNRLNEASANRANANRLFDSQNNNRGGYNVADKTAAAFGNNAEREPSVMYDWNDLNTPQQYYPVYFEGSELLIEWTNQHGCGGREEPQIDPVTGEVLPRDPHKLNCNIVIQYMCDTDATVTDPGMTVRIRNGRNTGTSNQANEASQIAAVTAQNINDGHGVQESEAYYYECSKRSRNRGLFLADQKLNGNSARYTRQNNNGNRYGQECPEERDYYPYWSPSPWRDIAYLTDNLTYCEQEVQRKSINNNQVCKCTSSVNYVNTPVAGIDAMINAITETDCAAAGGTWKCFTHGLPAPECLPAPWTRVNHLGNTDNGQMASYNWTLPRLSELTGVAVSADGFAKCAIRVRYNMSTDDYDPYNTFAEHNDNPKGGYRSPVTNNPTVDVGANFQGLRLAINTAQFGRTFQDRTHAFHIKARPAAWSNFNNYRIVNVVVRGKRGNIVQTYPANEYDFAPNRLHVAPRSSSRRTLVHIQWWGSNTHNNGEPAGDGQAGDAGEGTGGTDRHNLVQIEDLGDNYPIPQDKYWHLLASSEFKSMFRWGQCWDFNGQAIASTSEAPDCPLLLATGGYYRTAAQLEAAVAAAGDGEVGFDPLLNTSPASLVGGVLMELQYPGTYHYMCTRNNNFSNRSQKGTIIVDRS